MEILNKILQVLIELNFQYKLCFVCFKLHLNSLVCCTPAQLNSSSTVITVWKNDSAVLKTQCFVILQFYMNFCF